MQYYNSRGELLEFSDKESFNHWTTANIYKLEEDICFKMYYTYIANHSRMSNDVFNIIKK